MNDLSSDAEHAERVAALLALMEIEHAAFDDPHPLHIHPDSLDSEVFDYENVERWVDRWQPQWIIDTYFQDLKDS